MDIALIALPVFLKLGQPKIQPGFRQPRELAAWVGVSVKKAAVNEDYGLPGREYEVGSSRELGPVESVSVSQGVNETPDKKLGFGMLAPDTGHPLAALGFRQSVHVGRYQKAPNSPYRGF